MSDSSSTSSISNEVDDKNKKVDNSATNKIQNSSKVSVIDKNRGKKLNSIRKNRENLRRNISTDSSSSSGSSSGSESASGSSTTSNSGNSDSSSSKTQKQKEKENSSKILDDRTSLNSDFSDLNVTNKFNNTKSPGLVRRTTDSPTSASNSISSSPINSIANNNNTETTTTATNKNLTKTKGILKTDKRNSTSSGNLNSINNLNNLSTSLSGGGLLGNRQQQNSKPRRSVSFYNKKRPEILKAENGLGTRTLSEEFSSTKGHFANPDENNNDNNNSTQQQQNQQNLEQLENTVLTSPVIHSHEIPYGGSIPTSLYSEAEKDTLIAEYLKSCKQNQCDPINAVYEQLQNLPILSHDDIDDSQIDTVRNIIEDHPRFEKLSLRGLVLSSKNVEPLEEILKRIKFKVIDLECVEFEDSDAAIAIIEMMEFYDSTFELLIGYHSETLVPRVWSSLSKMVRQSACLKTIDIKASYMPDATMVLGLRYITNRLTIFHF